MESWAQILSSHFALSQNHYESVKLYKAWQQMSYWEMNTTNKRFSSCNYNLIPSVPIFTFIPMFSMSRIEVSETLVFYGFTD